LNQFLFFNKKVTISGGIEAGMINKMKIKYKLLLLIVVFIMGFSVFGILANRIIQDIKIKGDIYNQIIQGKDVVADIMLVSTKGGRF
jgi:hypothetical protein